MTASGKSSFEDLTIHGFRRLYDVHLNLRPLSVMIGANGTGKTSILDALSLLARSAQGKMSESISELSGLTNLLTYDKADDLQLGISMTVPGHQPLEYSLKLRPQAVAYEISEERLWQHRQGYPEPFLHIDSHGANIHYYEKDQKKIVRPTWDFKPLETSLSQVPKMFQQPEDFRNRLSSSTFYHVLNVDPRSPVRVPQPMQPAALPGRNGEELVSCLFYLRETERSRFEAIEDALRAAFPRFDRLDFPPVAAGTLALTWRETESSKPFYMHQLSEGTLRFLWLATLLQSPGLTWLTLLDEPEVSLHPELLRLLADMMREASNRTQLVVATHSDRLIRFLQPKEIVVMDADEDGMTALKWADELDLDEWLKDYSLDELWSNGRLGARA
jgi:predicted ATPase